MSGFLFGAAASLGGLGLLHIARGLAQRPPPPLRLSPANSMFFLCDVQEKFRTAMPHMPHLIASCKALLSGAEILKVPVVVTEQYPKGLGRTLQEFEVANAKVFEKTLFSMCTPEVLEHLGSAKRNAVVLFGLETHVCVQQTALDLLARGYSVVIVADAAASQRMEDRATAISLLRQAGVVVTSVESLLMELIRGKDAAEFKQISGLIKMHAEAVKQLDKRLPAA